MANEKTPSGKVIFVGAGPGDPGLITVRGLRCLQEADVVLYDRLVDPRLLNQAREGAELVEVGKERGKKRLEQEEINALLVARAREGKRVVRLKGGDPLVFGRGAEEMMALVQARLPFEVVPGVTSAIAAPAYAGIPLTHRALASSFAVVTGSEDPSKGGSRVQWEKLAQAVDTLVVLMGLETLPQITTALMNGGMPATTPVALVQWGTEPYQRTVVGPLKDIAVRAQEARLKPPVVAIFGQVVGLREGLRWFDNKPLFGKRVLVTRARPQTGTLVQLLLEEGAEPLELPVLELRASEDLSSLDRALARLDTYQWIVFTSANGVKFFFQRLRQQGRDARALRDNRVCAIGPATARALEVFGITADWVPQEYISEAVVEGMRQKGIQGCRVLLPRSESGREVLARGLARLGALVEEVPVYRAQIPPDASPRARELLTEGVDVVTFTSPSTVRHLLALLGGDKRLLQNTTIACIGPVTAAQARELGLAVHVVAREYTIPGLVRALVEHFQKE